jgi:hypothetical protein
MTQETSSSLDPVSGTAALGDSQRSTEKMRLPMIRHGLFVMVLGSPNNSPRPLMMKPPPSLALSCLLVRSGAGELLTPPSCSVRFSFFWAGPPSAHCCRLRPTATSPASATGGACVADPAADANQLAFTALGTQRVRGWAHSCVFYLLRAHPFHAGARGGGTVPTQGGSQKKRTL